MTFKPMLAGKFDPALAKFPCLASPKLDGIRALAKNNRLITRSLLDVPNKYTFERLRYFPGLDGELIMGQPTAPDVYRRTNSAVMSREGQPELSYFVFDLHDSEDSAYMDRLEELKHNVERSNLHLHQVMVLPHQRINSQDELEHFEEEHVALGYEGVMVRALTGRYKYGRSTTNEGWLLKVKRFDDSEAYVIDVIEEQFNGNVAEKDNLGRTKRSSAAEGKSGKGTMGALHVVDVKTEVDFFIGSGFTAPERIWWWEHREKLLAFHPRATVKYKYFAVGVKDKPRHPVFAGLRSELDL